ncbi:hypothetical protein B0H66DRAFT_595410 [Apodospora peruviana]|uniref:Uncharacterized protein n=1 Tax=Apodospora peruviana TaxID=516989 RepID=A0AAE0HU30_9PEZI|nr:hypothetical protein B0H66DRAFT_595410 [Apodospora peruviana]
MELRWLRFPKMELLTVDTLSPFGDLNHTLGWTAGYPHLLTIGTGSDRLDDTARVRRRNVASGALAVSVAMCVASDLNCRAGRIEGVGPLDKYESATTAITQSWTAAASVPGWPAVGPVGGVTLIEVVHDTYTFIYPSPTPASVPTTVTMTHIATRTVTRLDFVAGGVTNTFVRTLPVANSALETELKTRPTGLAKLQDNGGNRSWRKRIIGVMNGIDNSRYYAFFVARYF